MKTFAKNIKAILGIAGGACLAMGIILTADGDAVWGIMQICLALVVIRCSLTMKLMHKKAR